MLTREQAEQQLRGLRSENWEEQLLAGLRDVPPALAGIARSLMKRDENGQPYENWQIANAMAAVAFRGLDLLSAEERGQLLCRFFPKIAHHVEAAWQFLRTTPYQTWSGRRASRTADDAEASWEHRKQWFGSLIQHAAGYDQDLEWFAAWAPHLHYGLVADSLGGLFAAAIDAGGAEGEAVFNVLRDSMNNCHPVGAMGRHVIRGLLSAVRPEGWELVEKLLLAAQRQEGLRQVVLETIDEAHPKAFRRMLRLILDNNLARFSSVVRAVDVWFGFGLEAGNPKDINRRLETVLTLLDDPVACDAALGGNDPELAFLALWSLACNDAPGAVEPAVRLLDKPDVEMRFIGAHFLGMLGLPAARRHILRCLDDADLGIAARACAYLPYAPWEAEVEADDEPSAAVLASLGQLIDRPPAADQPSASDVFDAVKRLIDRLPDAKVELPPLVWPWNAFTCHRSNVAEILVRHLGKRSPREMIPYLRMVSPWSKAGLVEQLAKQEPWDAATRDTLFSLVGDNNNAVREKALEALKKCSVTAEEAIRLEGLLTRKTQETRRAALIVLQQQADAATLASADRLLASAKPEQRLGGLELLRQLAESGRLLTECNQRGQEYAAARRKLNDQEQTQLKAIAEAGSPVPTLENALGLLDRSGLTPRVPPTAKKVAFWTPASIACAVSLDELIESHKETTITVETYQGQKQELLGNLQGWGLPLPDAEKSTKVDAARLPLRQIWEDWFKNRPEKLRDRDGLELCRLFAAFYPEQLDAMWGRDNFYWFGQYCDKKQWLEAEKTWADFNQTLTAGVQLPKLKHAKVIDRLLLWFIRLHPPAGAVTCLLDALETGCSLIPAEVLKRIVDPYDWDERKKDWRNASPLLPWFNALQQCENYLGDQVTKKIKLRIWHLMHWRDQPSPGVTRFPPDVDVLLTGEATYADLAEQMFCVPGDFKTLAQVTSRNVLECLDESPELMNFVESCRQRILEVELARGKALCSATDPALAIASVPATETLFRLIAALGKAPFSRRSGKNRDEVLTHLIECSYPAPTDTAEDFAERVKAAGIEVDRLLSLAFLNPIWLPFVDHTLGWPGLTEGVWWFLAHISGGKRGIDTTVEEVDEQGKTIDQWARLIRERTPLTDEERAEGAVDVAWFHRVQEPLGRKCWHALAEAAKYGGRDQGYKKPIRLGEVLQGRAKRTELVNGIRQKKLRESVVLLGLLPLPDGVKRESELKNRYQVLQEYRRYAKGLGAMSRESAVRSADLGLANLARTAGFTDPIRLEWAMEIDSIADLARGPVSVTQDAVTLSLQLDESAQPELAVEKNGKAIKSLPAPLKKKPKFAALFERRTELKRSASRMRESLEGAMVRGDLFSGGELRQLFAHPLLAPALGRLVLVGDDVLGYPSRNGLALRDHRGRTTSLKKNAEVRIAHPQDFLTAGTWPAWQHECFATERVQPFKQVFRELYVLTKQEKSDGTASHRYAGQQVNQNQAMALWGGRGWSVRDGVSKTFHDAGLTAYVTFHTGVTTPAEVEGPAVEAIQFHRRGEWKPMKLLDVPPRLFSEVMRDCDLVVSVAHAGGVDPEASASTVEMRAALLRETLSLLQIANVRFKPAHVLVDGKLGKYSVHLGSGVVHRQPGGSICIVPVHSQQRGRLFLPFADDDPRTAEVLSKVLLLARDDEIQDPTILEQIR